MLTVLEQIAILDLFLAVGWFFGRWKREQTAHTSLLSFLLVHAFLPCKVFSNFSTNFTLSYLRTHGVAVLVSLGLLLALIPTSLLLARLLTKNPYEQKVYRYTFTVSNYAYVGYALTEGVFGADALTDLILFCIPFAIYTYSFGYALLTGQEKPWRRLLNPVTAAIVLGCLCGLCSISLPSVLRSVIDRASACFGPISMLLTGLTLSLFSFRELMGSGKAYLVCAIRLIGIPAVVYGLCQGAQALGILPSSVYPAAVLMACMPCGLNTVVFPRLIGEDCTIGARLAFLSHLMALLTLPLWLTVIA